jgi:hypothetical protein
LLLELCLHVLRLHMHNQMLRLDLRLQHMRRLLLHRQVRMRLYLVVVGLPGGGSSRCVHVARLRV